MNIKILKYKVSVQKTPLEHQQKYKTDLLMAYILFKLEYYQIDFSVRFLTGMGYFLASVSIDTDQTSKK